MLLLCSTNCITGRNILNQLVLPRTWRQFFSSFNAAAASVSFYMVHTCNTIICFDTPDDHGLKRLQLTKVPGDWVSKDCSGICTFMPGAPSLAQLQTPLSNCLWRGSGSAARSCLRSRQGSRDALQLRAQRLVTTGLQFQNQNRVCQSRCVCAPAWH